MKYLTYFILVLAILSIALSCAPNSSPEIEDQVAFYPDIDAPDVFSDGLINQERSVLDELIENTLYKIQLQIAGNLTAVSGYEEIIYTNRESVPLNEIYLLLFPNLGRNTSEITSVKLNNVEVAWDYTLEDSVIQIPITPALQPKGQIILEIQFRLYVNEAGFTDNFDRLTKVNETLLLDGFYPVVPVYDESGWNIEVPPSSGDSTYLDASYYLVRVSTTRDLTVLASGSNISLERSGDNQVITFAAGPARDFFLAASKDLKLVTDKVGETTINSYATKKYTEGAELALDYATKAIQIFNQRFGQYPYTEFDILGAPLDLALGIEYPGATVIDSDYYDPTHSLNNVPSKIILETTVVHEVAHQWFYNAVGNDQVKEPWLDEALAQYATYVYYRDRYGEANAISYRDSWLNRWARINQAEIPIGLPSTTYTPQEYSAIVYGRGPIFIMTLADEMGPDTFGDFLQDYYQMYKWEITHGDLFAQLAQEHCGCDLTILFNNWVFS